MSSMPPISGLCGRMSQSLSIASGVHSLIYPADLMANTSVLPSIIDQRARQRSIPLASFEVREHGVQFIELQLAHVHVTEEIAGKSLELLVCFSQPHSHRMGALSQPRVVTRRPRPAAKQAKTCTIRTPHVSGPWRIVPGVSKTEPSPPVQWTDARGTTGVPIGTQIAKPPPATPAPRTVVPIRQQLPTIQHDHARESQIHQ
jgi:hypothetical protein